jgi:protoporphyrinogen oxidase
MAGFGAAHRLREEGVPAVLYEKKPYYGGHTATYSFEAGFVFDDGPHISFTKDRRIQDLLAASVGGEYQVIKAHVNNYWRGIWIKHPAPCNLHGLPVQLVEDIICDLVEARSAPAGEPRTYADWLVATYGRTFAETFPMEYGLKYHTTAADTMTTDWLGPRLYVPQLREVLHGALVPSTPDVHYVGEFRYPTTGGFVSYLKPFAARTDLRLGHDLVRLDPAARTLHFANGTVAGYSRLISSIPLPELVRRIAGVPADVSDAASRLACSSCVIVNLGVARDDLSSAHWTYFYDRDLTMTRIAFPHMQSPNNVPPGHGSIQAEVYFSSKYRPCTAAPASFIDPVIGDLRRCGILRDDDRIVFRHAAWVPYANVIFDLERAPALSIVQGYLEELGIDCCGRYGEWGYHWTDEAFTSGERAAERALDRVSDTVELRS